MIRDAVVDWQTMSEFGELCHIQSACTSLWLRKRELPVKKERCDVLRESILQLVDIIPAITENQLHMSTSDVTGRWNSYIATGLAYL